ncbi:MAG: choice-of-anchor B family protein [Phycisphaerales bacterium]
MRISSRRASVCSQVMLSVAGGALALAIATPAIAHPDDPKILDKMPRIESPGWSLQRSERAEPGVAQRVEQLGFAAQGVVLQSWLSLPDFGSFANANDCWGYTSPSGREYAILGLNSATAFIEITDPAAPVIVSIQPGPDSLWRDVKTYQSYAYSVSEGGGGIQVFNLVNIDSGVVTLANTISTGGTAATHNVAINTDSGYLYRCGGSDNGLRIYRLNQFPEGPASPVFVASWATKYVHDAQIVSYTTGPYAGKEIAFCCAGFNGGFGETGLTILDVTNKSNITILGQVQYTSAAYSHQGWLTEDKQYFLLNDELDEQSFGTTTTTRVIDVSDLANPVEVGTFTNGLPSVDHNLYTKGDLMFAANYRSGLRVFDISSLPNAQEIAFFDTFPNSDSASFNGLWSVYPYFPSGTVIGSDIERGLFVWSIETPPFSIEVYQADPPQLLSPDGATVLLTITPEDGQQLAPGTATLFYSVDGGPFQSTPMQQLTGNFYNANFPSFPCLAQIDWYVSAQSVAGQEQLFPFTAPTNPLTAIAAYARDTAYFDDMEGVSSSWQGGVPGDTASTGQWVRVNPNPTAAQPGQDTTPDGVRCWVTGQGSPGGPLGEADVDNGITALLSPILSAVSEEPGAGDAYLSYQRWYSNDLGAAPNSDSMPIEISNNGGSTWSPLELVTENAGAWVRKEFRIADFITPTSTMRLRFIARDLDPGSVVEAGVDDVEIFFYRCDPFPTIPGDLNQSCTVDSNDLAILLGAFGNSPAGDLNDDGVTDSDDLAILLSNFGTVCED